MTRGQGRPLLPPLPGAAQGADGGHVVRFPVEPTSAGRPRDLSTRNSGALQRHWLPLAQMLGAMTVSATHDLGVRTGLRGGEYHEARTIDRRCAAISGAELRGSEARLG
jgi:hypothetical protein